MHIENASSSSMSMVKTIFSDKSITIVPSVPKFKVKYHVPNIKCFICDRK